MPAGRHPPDPEVSSIPPHPFCPGTWWRTLLLAACVFGLMLFNNRTYLFDTKLHELSDYAADSLLVQEAKHGWLLHGHYSRWGFYHPGPALLDVLASGEALFYDTLHWVPTPLNGQLIALCLALSLFFGLALSIFARRLGRERGGYFFFLPCALIFALWHYGAAQSGSSFQSVWPGQVLLNAWPVYPPLLVLLCFLVASASVASGSGRDLPALVLAGGWLVHNYIAFPLFVVPITLLAYAGLVLASRHREQATGFPPPAGVLTAAWRAAPRAHAIAGVLLALYLLPLALDALHGADSNWARIFHYLRSASHNPVRGKSWLASACYFVVFGGYDLFQAHRPDFGRYSAASMFAFIGLHWRAYSLWAITLLAPPLLFLAARRRAAATSSGLPGRTGSFVPWFYVVTAAAVGLTLVWGRKQDGPMYFYPSYFNFSIYFCAALGLAAALSTALCAWTGFPARRWLRPGVSALLWLGVAGAAVQERDAFRAAGFLSTPELDALVACVDRAAATLPQGAVCLLDERPSSNWVYTTVVALELERLGHDFRVNDLGEVMYGTRHAVGRAEIPASVPLVRWVVASGGGTPPDASHLPLFPGLDLEIKPPPALDPAGTSILFTPDGNYTDFAYYGWWPSDGPTAWSDTRSALLCFRPLPLPVDAVGVEVLISASSFQAPGETTLQRVMISFDDVALGAVALPANAPEIRPVSVRVSAASWQAAVARGSGRLHLDFPDAKSPDSISFNGDTRLLGGAFRKIEFRSLPADAAR